MATKFQSGEWYKVPVKPLNSGWRGIDIPKEIPVGQVPSYFTMKPGKSVFQVTGKSQSGRMDTEYYPIDFYKLNNDGYQFENQGFIPNVKLEDVELINQPDITDRL